VGDCVALSLNDVGERSYQGCSCDEPIPFVCESADESPDFDCPDDGFFASGPCSDLWYNCWGGEMLKIFSFFPSHDFFRALHFCTAKPIHLSYKT
jgi:hypothetical protein